MKRFALGVLALAIAFSLYGCGAFGSETDSTSEGANTDESAGIEVEDRDAPESAPDADGAADSSDPSHMEIATEKMEEISAASGMDVNAVAIDLETGEYGGVGGNESVVSASMIKMVVAAAFLDKAAAVSYTHLTLPTICSV